MEGSFRTSPLLPEGVGGGAGRGAGCLLSRSIAFSRISSRTPGEGSFLDRKQLGQRKAADRPQGNHEPEEAAWKSDSVAGEPEVAAPRGSHTAGMGSPVCYHPRDVKGPGCLLVNCLIISQWAGGCTSHFEPCLLPHLQARVTF